MAKSNQSTTSTDGRTARSKVKTAKSRTAARKDSATPSSKIPTKTPSNDDYDVRVRAYRRRQASVATILEETFGEPAKCSPDLWEQRTYLMLVGLVYERLASNESEIPTDELVALAKILAENRRAAARSPSSNASPAAEAQEKHSNGPLPSRLRSAVRQLYGADFDAAEPARTAESG